MNKNRNSLTAPFVKQREVNRRKHMFVNCFQESFSTECDVLFYYTFYKWFRSSIKKWFDDLTKQYVPIVSLCFPDIWPAVISMSGGWALLLKSLFRDFIMGWQPPPTKIKTLWQGNRPWLIYQIWAALNTLHWPRPYIAGVSWTTHIYVCVCVRLNASQPRGYVPDISDNGELTTVKADRCDQAGVFVDNDVHR